MAEQLLWGGLQSAQQQGNALDCTARRFFASRPPSPRTHTTWAATQEPSYPHWHEGQTEMHLFLLNVVPSVQCKTWHWDSMRCNAITGCHFVITCHGWSGSWATGNTDTCLDAKHAGPEPHDIRDTGTIKTARQFVTSILAVLREYTFN